VCGLLLTLKLCCSLVTGLSEGGETAQPPQWSPRPVELSRLHLTRCKQKNVAYMKERTIKAHALQLRMRTRRSSCATTNAPCILRSRVQDLTLFNRVVKETFHPQGPKAISSNVIERRILNACERVDLPKLKGFKKCLGAETLSYVPFDQNSRN
jgi:hypothetical protein